MAPRTVDSAPPTAERAPPAARDVSCDAHQRALAQDADRRASPWSLEQHLGTHFPDGRVAWLMPEPAYQKYIVAPHAPRFGRCNDSGCYLFVAPAARIEAVVSASMREGAHDPAALATALGLPAKNLEGPLRLIMLDLDDTRVCVRLPVEDDPGVWKCASPEDTSCWKPGGFTAGGIPELMVLDAPVASATIVEVP